MPGNTFAPIELNAAELADLSFDDVYKKLDAKLDGYRKSHTDYYQAKRKKNAGFARASHKILALAGALAFLLTGLAAALRFIKPEQQYDLFALVAVLAIYAMMGGLSFFDRYSGIGSSYLRHVDVIIGIRDLWTKYQFEALKVLTAAKATPDADERTKKFSPEIQALAAAFCADLNKISGNEADEWRTAVSKSLTELETLSSTNQKTVLEQAQKAVTASKAAAAEAKEAARIATVGGKTGFVNVVIALAFDGEITIKLDDQLVEKGLGARHGVGPLAPGLVKISIEGDKDGKPVRASQIVDVKPGANEAKF